MAYQRARTPAPRSTLPQNVSSPFAGRPFQPTVAPAEKPPLAEESRAEVRPTFDFTKVPVHSAAQRPNKTLPHDPEEAEAERFQLKSHAGAAGSDREKPEEPPNRTGLPGNLKAGIESLSGLSLADVKVHYNSSQPAQLSALAYAQGSDIYVAPGQERHLPHEAWHIVQQAEGRVKPTRPMKPGVPINDDERLEHEADVMGAKALATAPHLHGAAGATAEPAQQRAAPGTPATQMQYELCQPQDVTFTSDHRAGVVEAKNISGSTLGPAANSPSVSPFGWEQLKAAGHTLANKSGTNSHYNAVRAHLMNGRLGGPGDDARNLAPAPAQVNSMMSAGPETKAKDLVDAGHTIWLRTTVSYLSQSNIATDFTAVVPNQIRMEWGPMGKTGQAWSTDIDLPVAPLQGADVLEYQNWDSAKTAELVAKLQNQSNQVRAQAFDLVLPGDLKFAILNAYPQVFLSMERVAKGRVLGDLTDNDRLILLDAMGASLANPDQLVAEGVLPLAAAGKSIEAQNLFVQLAADKQRAALISWKDELLPHLGQIGADWSKKDFTIFRYNDSWAQAHLVNGMSKTELDAFLGERTKPERIAILNGWADVFGAGNADQKATAVKGNVNIDGHYQAEYVAWIKKKEESDQFKLNRPQRVTKLWKPETKLWKPTKKLGKPKK